MKPAPHSISQEVIKPNTSFPYLLRQYTKLIRVKDYKTGCGNQYTQAITEFFQFLKKRGYAHFQVTSQDMIDYYQYLQSRPNKRRIGTLSQNTINHHLFAIRILFDYLLQSKTYDALPVIPKYLRSPRQTPEVLSVQEIKLMYQKADNQLETALLSLAYGCGLRRSEISGLHLRDIDLKKANLIVRAGKNKKRREVPLSHKVISDLNTYIHNQRNQRKKRKSYHLILSIYGHPLSGYAINETIKAIAKRVPELEHRAITLHALRRSIATHLAEKGAGIHFIKEFLGHSQIDTSQLYVIRNKRGRGRSPFSYNHY